MFFFNGRRDRDPNVQIFFPFSDLMSLSNSCRWYFGRCFLGWQKDHRLFPSVRSSSFYCIHLQWYPSSISFFSFFFGLENSSLFSSRASMTSPSLGSSFFFFLYLYIFLYYFILLPDIKEERNIWAHVKREREGNEKDKDKTRFQSVRSRLYFYYYLKKKKKGRKKRVKCIALRSFQLDLHNVCFQTDGRLKRGNEWNALNKAMFIMKGTKSKKKKGLLPRNTIDGWATPNTQQQQQQLKGRRRKRSFFLACVL